MSRGHMLWLVASFAISFSTNHVLRPRFDYAPFADGPTLPSGELIFSGGARGSIKLVDVRVITGQVDPLLGDPIAVRELLLRGALSDGQTETDLELFVDWSEGAPALGAGARMDALKGRPLTVVPVAVAGDVPSRIRLPGSDDVAQVVRGTLTLNEVLELGPFAYRVRGDLDMEVRQGGETLPVIARLAAKVVWD